MAVISISKIQVRRGLYQEMRGVNLSAGELCWTMDRNRLFIGNGEIAEGASRPGNTEVLTEKSNNLDLIDHRYLGRMPHPAGPQPTVNLGWQVSRMLQERLDDQINIKSFGVRGDGNIQPAMVEQETLNIRRALFEMFLQDGITFDGTGVPSDPAYYGRWRALYWPAGLYVIDRPIPLLRKMILLGDGSGRTIIILKQPTSEPYRHNFVIGSSVFATETPSDFYYPDDDQLLADTGAVGSFSFGVPLTGNIGALGFPVQDCYVRGISFINHHDLGDVAHLVNCSNVTFEDVDFEGAYYDSRLTQSSGTLAADSPLRSKCIYVGQNLLSLPFAQRSRDIYLNNCRLRKRGIGLYAGDEISHVVVQNSTFERLHDGINLGENLAAMGNPVGGRGPGGVQVTGSLFNSIRRYSMAVFTPNGGNGSRGNVHRNVGTPLGEDGTPISTQASAADFPMILFGAVTEANHVIADAFWRNDLPAPTNLPRIRDLGTDRNDPTDVGNLVLIDRIGNARGQTVGTGLAVYDGLDPDSGNLRFHSVTGTAGVAVTLVNDTLQVSIDPAGLGVTPVAKGGTGIAAVPVNRLLVGSGGQQLNILEPTGTDTVLRWTGSSYNWVNRGASFVTHGAVLPAAATNHVVLNFPLATMNALIIFYTIKRGNNTRVASIKAVADGTGALASYDRDHHEPLGPIQFEIELVRVGTNLSMRCTNLGGTGDGYIMVNYLGWDADPTS